MKVKSGSFLEVFNYKDLLNQLVSRDIKLKYRRSFLGYVWSILNPLLIMIVMVIVFSKMFNRSIPHFPVYLFAGRILYEFVIGACGKALGSITDNSSLLKKTYVSKFMFPLAKITSSLVDCLFSLGAFLIVIIFTRSPFAQLHVFFRDTRYIWNAVTTAWMYCSAIFYPIDMLPDWLKLLVNYFNPLYVYIKQFRCIAHQGVMPDLTTIGLGFLYAFFFFGLGVLCFKKNQDKFILYI